MSIRDKYPSQAAYGRYDYVVLTRRSDYNSYLLIRDCPFCGKEARVIVPAQGLWNWEHGDFVQQAFPNLSSADREMILTGTHDECWEKYMKPPKDES